METKNLKYGLQKMTLLDFPGKVACTVFSSGCNFRCPFCHNAGLVLPDADRSMLMDQAEILAFLRKRQGLLDGVCLTGGEPLLFEENLAFMREIKALGYAVKLDTNGAFPERLKQAVAEGLADYVAMDIKNAPDAYAETAGLRVDQERIGESVDFLLSGAVPYEFRTTVVLPYHTDERMEAIGKWIAGTEKYFLQQYKDENVDLLGDPATMRPANKAQMEIFLAIIRKYVPGAELRGIE